MENILIIVCIVLCALFIGFVIYCVMKKNKEMNLKYNDLKSKYSELEKSYDRIRDYYESHNAIKNELNEYTIINDKELKIFTDDLCNLEYYINEKNGIIPSKVNEQIYPLSDIKYYKIKGSERKEQYVSGGGSSIKGAVVGGIIAGDTGAIIGSRKVIETTYKDVDNREIIVTLKDGKEIELVDLECYELLLDYIPEKEYDNYIENKKSKGKNQHS